MRTCTLDANGKSSYGQSSSEQNTWMKHAVCSRSIISNSKVGRFEVILGVSIGQPPSVSHAVL